MIVKMPGHQRDIDVAALANRLSVVHGFQHGQAPGVFLYLPRQSVHITCPRVRSDGLPLWKRGACSLDSSINVGG